MQMGSQNSLSYNKKIKLPNGQAIILNPTLDIIGKFYMIDYNLLNFGYIKHFEKYNTKI
jgi:hypothetical protein